METKDYLFTANALLIAGLVFIFLYYKDLPIYETHFIVKKIFAYVSLSFSVVSMIFYVNYYFRRKNDNRR